MTKEPSIATVDSEERDRIDRFMLAEYGAMQDGRDSMNAVMNSRVNVFFTLAALSGTALTVVKNSGMGKMMNYAVPSAMSLLALLGFMVFIWLLESRITLIGYVRGMNRIRRYFSENCPHVRQYLVEPVDDSLPPFVFGYLGSSRYDNLSHLSGIVALIDTAALMGLSASLCQLLSLSPPVGFGACVFSFGASLFGHIRYQDARMVRAEAQYNHRTRQEIDRVDVAERAAQPVGAS